jgi:hypothetical protein
VNCGIYTTTTAIIIVTTATTTTTIATTATATANTNNTSVGKLTKIAGQFKIYSPACPCLVLL